MRKEYSPLFLSGIVIVIGWNMALSIRDSKMFRELEQREEIYRQHHLEVVPYSDHQA